MKSLYSVSIVLLCLLLPFPGKTQTIQPNEAALAFRNGTQAFKTGDFGAALKHFRQAETLGYSSDALSYNLGVMYYKFMWYARSRQYFERLAAKDNWRELAHYNIALVLQRQGEKAAAQEQFLQLAREAQDEKIRHLAKQALGERGEKVADARERRDSSVLLSLSAGRDDNVVAFPEILQIKPSEGADDFSELLAYGHTYAGGKRGDGVRIQGYAYTRHYQDFDNFDTAAASVGISREHSAGNWNFDYGLTYSQSAVDGEKLSGEARLSLGASKTSGANRYSFAYSAGHHDAGEYYPQLEGMNHRLDAKWRHAAGNWRWRMRYRLDVNKRDDLDDSGVFFFSYSPVRNSVELKADWLASDRWKWTLGGEFERADYKKENILIDADGIFRIEEREADTVKWWLRSEFAVAADWRLYADWRRIETDDTFLLYSYERELVRFGLEYGF